MCMCVCVSNHILSHLTNHRSLSHPAAINHARMWLVRGFAALVFSLETKSANDVTDGTSCWLDSCLLSHWLYMCGPMLNHLHRVVAASR